MNADTHFSNLAHHWWDPQGPLKTLHALNPVRTDWIISVLQHNGIAIHPATRVLDVGCGGGILSESLAQKGLSVTGIDIAPELIHAAKRNAKRCPEYHSRLQYCAQDTASHAERVQREKLPLYDAIVCMELLEHVPNPKVLLAQLATLLRTGGVLSVSTLNRSLSAFVQSIVLAEYTLGIIPIGTHEYQKYITPGELCGMLHRTGFWPGGTQGMHYCPFTHHAFLVDRMDVSYACWALRCG